MFIEGHDDARALHRPPLICSSVRYHAEAGQTWLHINIPSERSPSQQSCEQRATDRASTGRVNQTHTMLDETFKQHLPLCPTPLCRRSKRTLCCFVFPFLNTELPAALQLAVCQSSSKSEACSLFFMNVAAKPQKIMKMQMKRFLCIGGDVKSSLHELAGLATLLAVCGLAGPSQVVWPF